jgi:hypothetical protein
VAFGFPEDSGDQAGEYLLFKKQDTSLAVYSASGSVWYQEGNRTIGLKGDEGAFSSEEEACRRAKEILFERSLWLNSARLLSLSETQGTKFCLPRIATDEVPSKVEQHVNFGFVIDDIPVVGPGGRMRVSFRGERPVAIFRFFREPVEIGDVDIISVESAQSFLRHDPSIAGMEDVSVSEPLLSYLGFSPSLSQNSLLPVYAFRVDLKSGERPVFLMKYVQAVEGEALDGLPRVL